MSLLELYCAVDDFCQGMTREQVGRFLGDGSQRALGDVVIRPGGLVVVSTRSFPAGYNHAGPKDD